ncbi:MAG: DinB family protein [bacterium]
MDEAIIRSALKSQYHCTLDMLEAVIEQCPEPCWVSPDHTAPCWQIAYHALFYTHMYLQRDIDSFRPWEQHLPEYQFIGALPNGAIPRIGAPYSKENILAYLALCRAMVDSCVDAMDLNAPECGFPWYTMGKLEHQLNNIRHVQHHTAQLNDRLKRYTGTGVKWMQMASRNN